MSSRVFDPTRLDVEKFAAEGAEIEGRWPLRQFDRVSDLAPSASAPTDADEVVWRARGERLASRAELQTWLQVEAATAVTLECQRCLAPVEIALAVERRLRFVHGEDAAALLDAESEADVLAMTRALDLRELIEDELLLALPLVPMHAECPVPLPAVRNEAAAEDQPHPFAALAALKPRGPAN